MEEIKKLYSKRAIGIATFFGGPLAAGYLVKKNLEVLEQPENARKSMFFGITGTILIFVLFMILPDWLIDAIPNALIPLIYTGIIMYLVEKTHGKEITSHKETGGEFHSAWNAAGIGAIGMVILFAGGVSVMYLSGDLKYYNPGFNTKEYEKQMTRIQDNENQAIQVYKRYDAGDRSEIMVHDLNNATNLYNENIKIIQKLDESGSMPEAVREHNKLLVQYCNTRIELNRLLIKTIKEDTHNYDLDIRSVAIKIQNIMAEIQEINS